MQSIKRVASSFHHRQSQTVKRSFSNPSSSPSGAQEFYFQRNEHTSYKSTETGFEKEKKKKKEEKKHTERKNREKVQQRGRKTDYQEGMVKSSPRSYKAVLFIISLPARMSS